ncbi:sugar fermentation stimulation protein A [Salirhabdus euzebyi]|uniref:Sugar fermentation stimulation protein homolog n=1 Tax=Salirhabdus euzebyi TaxID=394506 RepID=A0A841Q290_9BACI|nr:DNA/RNA nuclease SfsA [Salirhabdus euzebyi]MBB6452295.1 sugar fermentation stimulation protein A [Salirhabdus euzebyi]
MFLPFENKLHKAIYRERVNRFILTCQLVETNELITVHLQDPGRLIELLVPENFIYVSYHDEPHRKTKWTAEIIQKPNETVFVSLRSTLPNRLISMALKAGQLGEYKPLSYSKQEYTYGHSRWDFLLENEQRKYLLEVKSVTMEKQGTGYFPDAPTKRGKKHVDELQAIQQRGEYQTGILFVCQREDISIVKPADWIDPAFAQSLRMAHENGVEIKARVCRVDLKGIYLGEMIPVELS